MKNGMKRVLSLFLVLTLLCVGLGAPAYATETAPRVEVGTDVPHTQTDNTQTNYFAFSAGNWSAGDAEHVWSNALDAAHPENTWYEVHFTGHKIDVYAGQNHMMNKVKYYIDDVEKGTYDLYHSSNVESTFIASFDGLDEGPHTFKAVATSERNSAATGNPAIDCAKVVVYTYVEMESGLFGGIVSDNLQYVQADYQKVVQDGVATKTLNAWKNDTAVSQIALASGGAELRNVAVTVSDFTGDAGTIPASAATATFVKSVQAYTGNPGYGSTTRAVPTGNRAEASEVLYQTTPLATMPAASVQPVWLSIDVPENAAAGTYTGTVTVSADGVDSPLVLTYTLNVADVVLPDATTFKDTFDIELWQNPFASAEYYNVEPFSERHFEILTPIMEKYKAIGGHAVTASIVDEAWAGQTYSRNDVHFPSMVEWTKNADDSWSFDYTDFDAWVTFNKDLGIGDKIVCYSVAPWTNAITYQNASGQTATIAKTDATAWNAAWTAFLEALMDHAEEKGWKDQIYIGIDERGFSNAAFDLIDSVVGTDGQPFKTAGAMDGFVSKHDLAMRVDDLNVGSKAVKEHPTEFEALRAERAEAGLRTTVYTCTEHCPGNFSLSAPGESYWTMMYSYSVGGQGYLRWAYDSWVADPLRDTTHNAFEAGDCFLIFPDEKDAANPRALSSLRLEKMAEGVRDVNKLMKIKADCPAMESAVDQLMGTILPNYDSAPVTPAGMASRYLTAAGRAALAEDMDEVKASIATLTEEYLERLATGDTKKLNIRPKDVPLVILPEEYQSDVEGPHPDQEAGRNGRRYLGQPDMIQTTNDTLVTVFPQGHGHGPLVMKKSEDKGESWQEITTPASWANSLETPTMYRLDFVNGTTRYVMITGRPNWDGNTKGGWDASISDDGLNWSESTTYHPTLPNGNQNWTIVAMASLVQLKDESGNFIDKWMGVYHDYGFVNYKTYLTFDAQGNMQWSEPEPYLPQYRDLETKYHICEVGMFRSPDGSRIMAMARSDFHNNVHASTMFWSDDEGETWSKPVEMQGALAGERHKARYDPISGRLVVTFREIIWDTNNNGVFEGANDWLAGDWIAWVGTYQDLMERNEGQYRILLDEDWANNTYSGDTGYTGMAVFDDGTFVLDTYGHWDKEFSQTQGLDVRVDLCWIRQAKFTLEQIDRIAAEQAAEEEANRLEEIDAAVLARHARANSEMDPASGVDGPAEWAFDDQAHWWHSRYSGTPGPDEVSSGQASESNHIWIETGFGEPRFIKELTYQTRSNGACAINGYEVQLACLADPAATPTDDDFVTVKEGNLANTTSAQTITLDKGYQATHVRLVATTQVHGTNHLVTAQRIRVYAATHGVDLQGRPLTPPTTPEVTVSNVTSDGATVTWTPSTASEGAAIREYQVFLGDAQSPVAIVRDGVTTALSGLGAATAYTVKVVAVDEFENRSEPGTADFTTLEATGGGEGPSGPTTGGTSRPAPSTTTETVENPDGSTTTTVTKPDGTVTETTEKPDGTVTEKVNSPKEGVTITVTDAEGEVEVQVTVPATIPEVPEESRFMDVPRGHWADRAIHEIASLGMVKGVDETGHVYDMSSAMTRGTIATVLYRFSNGKEGIENLFADVAQGQWYTDGVAWAAKTGVVTGYNDGSNFGPNDVITREQMATMLARYAGLIGLDTAAETAELDGFDDGAKTSAWAMDGIAWCVKAGIVQGKGGSVLDPKANITRAEAAVMLQRFIELMTK